MKVLLVTATALEFDALSPLETEGLERTNLITGIGGANMAIHLQKALFAHTYDHVILAGVAGVYEDENRIGEVVVVQKDRWADLGAEEKDGRFLSFDGSLLDVETPPYQDGWLPNTSLNGQLPWALVNAQ